MSTNRIIKIDSNTAIEDFVAHTFECPARTALMAHYQHCVVYVTVFEAIAVAGQAQRHLTGAIAGHGSAHSVHAVLPG